MKCESCFAEGAGYIVTRNRFRRQDNDHLQNMTGIWLVIVGSSFLRSQNAFKKNISYYKGTDKRTLICIPRVQISSGRFATLEIPYVSSVWCDLCDRRDRGPVARISREAGFPGWIRELLDSHNWKHITLRLDLDRMGIFTVLPSWERGLSVWWIVMNRRYRGTVRDFWESSYESYLRLCAWVMGWVYWPFAKARWINKFGFGCFFLGVWCML